jgi:hypothetical protein
VGRFLAAGRLLLADDMGLGKTAQAIASCAILWRARRIRRGLIIAPASLKPQWAREWAAFTDLPIRVVDGTPAERQALYGTHRSGFFIINYEQLIRDLETIRRWAPGLVVLDEAQRIKNWATKTALSVKGLDPPYRLVLTGTPMENRIEELASIVEWVDDMALEPKWRWAPCTPSAPTGTARSAACATSTPSRAPQALHGAPGPPGRARPAPSRTDVRVPVEMTEAQLEEHNALNQPIAQLVQRSKTRPLTQAEFLRLMSLLTTQRIISNGLAQLRFEEVWPSIRTFAPEESVIQGLSLPSCWSSATGPADHAGAGPQGRHLQPVAADALLAHWAVSDLLAENGLRAGFFTGAEGQRRRTQNIVEFHDDPRHRLLSASDAGGVGLNLQHASNCVINLELPWNPAVLEQRIGRVYRLGQTQPIDVYNLVCEQGIESRIAGLVGSKQAFFKGLFDGDTDAVQFEQSGSFLSRVEKIYDPSTLSDSAPPSGADDPRRSTSPTPPRTTRWTTRSRRSSTPPTSRRTRSRPPPRAARSRPIPPDLRARRRRPAIPVPDPTPRGRRRPRATCAGSSRSSRSAAGGTARSSSRPPRRRPPPSAPCSRGWPRCSNRCRDPRAATARPRSHGRRAPGPPP